MLTDEMLFDADEARYQRNAAAADAHLADLFRVYGQPLNGAHGPSYPQFMPWPAPTQVPARD